MDNNELFLGGEGGATTKTPTKTRGAKKPAIYSIGSRGLAYFTYILVVSLMVNEKVNVS